MICNRNRAITSVSREEKGHKNPQGQGLTWLPGREFLSTLGKTLPDFGIFLNWTLKAFLPGFWEMLLDLELSVLIVPGRGELSETGKHDVLQA